jgi:putative nucleotidyltransferase with HDIG domain
MPGDVNQFWEDLVGDIRANRVVLPTLPDVAIKARRLLENPKSTSAQIARAISADAVLTTRLLRVVNSPLYRAQTPIESVKTAITRLGNANIRSVITAVALEQIYQDKLASPLKKKLLSQNWEHSIMVAALSYFISRRYTRLNPEEAMLAGLIHDIGKLPILEYAERFPEIASGAAMLNRLLDVLHPRVGGLVLRSWKFSPAIILAVEEHEDLSRDPETPSDYCDVVIVANLLSYIGRDHPHTRRDWSTIPAFWRLALKPQDAIAAVKTAREEINELKLMLAG